MSRARKIGLIIGGSLVGLLLAVVVAGVLIARTEWFRNTVREKIVSSVEEATGGKVDVGSFRFDWTNLRAEVRDFVIHGLEPAGSPPLFRASLIEITLKLTSPFRGMANLESLLVDTPQANLMVFANGRTNIPNPKVKKESDKSGLETIVDLAIRHFDLRNGTLQFAEHKTAFSAKGENLRAQLAYNLANPSYTGEINIAPLHLAAGDRPPLDVVVRPPLRLEKDKVTLTNAHLNTPESEIVISADVDHLTAPRAIAKINARVTLEEAVRAGLVNVPLDTRRGPGVLNADIDAYADDQRVEVRRGRVTLGASEIEAHGRLKDGGRPPGVEFQTTLALNQLGRLLKSDMPEGVVKAGGNLKMTANRIELAGFRLAGFGGAIDGSASLENSERFRFSGNLRNFDIQDAARAFHAGPLPYDGVVSGPVEAQGNLKDAAGMVARANLSIAPGRRGTPVSGRIQADYNGRDETVTLGQSYLALPHSRVDLSGSLGQQIQIKLVSRDLKDLGLPVRLDRGAVNLTATVSGKLSAPQIRAHLAANDFAVEGRDFTSLAADVRASNSVATLERGLVTRGPMEARFTATVGLRNWKPDDRQPLRADATIRKADVQDLAALAGQGKSPLTGALTADAHIAGAMGDPRGEVVVNVSGGTIEEEPFDRLDVRATLTERSIDVPSLQLVAGTSRVDANATYEHPAGDLKTGVARVHVVTNQVDLARIRVLAKQRPGLGGTLSLTVDASGSVSPVKGETAFQLTVLNANAAARALRMEGQNLGDLTATANTAGQALRYQVISNFAGSDTRVNGESLLTGEHATNATASIANLPIEKVLAVAGKRDVPASGLLSVSAQLSGTAADPRAKGTFRITKGSAYQEPFDLLAASVNYSNRLIEAPSLRFAAGPNQVDLSASFSHPPENMEEGQVRFRVRSNRMQLARFHTVTEFKPGLAGALELAADGAATLRKGAAPLFSSLNANVAASGVTIEQKPMGNLNVTAETRGNSLAFKLDSDFARSNIHGDGRVELANDYPVEARLNFSNLTYSGLGNWLGNTGRAAFDASLDGQATVSGPGAKVEALRASLRLTKLEAHSIAPQTGAKPRGNLELHNEGPIEIVLDRSVVTIQQARITGPFTNLNLGGTADIGGKKILNVHAGGNIDLKGLESFDPDIFASGKVVLDAAVTGSMDKPAMNGRLQLEKASFNMTDLPNGIADAGGTIRFNGTEVVIENLAGQSGGGTVALSGSATYGGPEMRFRLQANVDHVRVHYPEAIFSQASARITAQGRARAAWFRAT